MTPSTPTQSALYCRHCGYNLQGHVADAPRCPECGRPFDPANPRTFRRRPIRRWLRHVKRAAYALLTLTLLLAAIWLWFFWGWYDEQQALRAVGTTANRLELISPQLRTHLGPLDFVLERTTGVAVHAKFSRDLTPLARLRKMDCLDLEGPGITDLRPLVSCPKLTRLVVTNASVNDFAPLATLPRLDDLRLYTRITDLRSLAGLTNLRRLDFAISGEVDLSPLAGMTKLEFIRLAHIGTRVADLRPLLGLKSLKRVSLPETAITEAQAEELRRALPGCAVQRF